MQAIAADTLTSETIVRHFLRRGHGVEFDMEVDWVRAQLPGSARRVLDLGCGGGTLLSAIGIGRAMGVDASPAGLSHTRRRFPSLPLVCASAERLPFTDDSMDALTLQHVAEHLPDLQRALAEWFRVLRPGGVVLILTPNARFVDPKVFEDPTHVRIVDEGELNNALAGAGFEVIDRRSLGLPWFRRWRGGWRLRRAVTRHAVTLSWVPMWRWKGQTLCCAARRPAR